MARSAFCSPTITRLSARACARCSRSARSGRSWPKRATGARLCARPKQLKPDVAVVDVAMPLLNGIEATRQITKRVPGVRVLVLSMYADEAYVTQMLKAGATGYLLKDSADVDLLQAVTPCRKGKSFFSPAVARLMLDDYAQPARRRTRSIATSRSRPRARDLPAGGRGQDQQGDRRAAVHQPEHGRNASRAHHGEARPPQRGRDRRSTPYAAASSADELGARPVWTVFSTGRVRSTLGRLPPHLSNVQISVSAMSTVRLGAGRDRRQGRQHRNRMLLRLV